LNNTSEAGHDELFEFGDIYNQLSPVWLLTLEFRATTKEGGGLEIEVEIG
jgi:hypothetical protein